MAERISVTTPALKTISLYAFDCPKCGVIFAVTNDFDDRRRKDGRSIYCPSGHTMSYTPGKSDADKLRDAQAREVAMQDQLDAAVREAEAQRVELARIRQRIANGVCPCCNRSFDNVRRHMASQHPDYAAPVVQPFKCSCHREFETLHGLRVHQGWSRREGWERKTSPYAQHLTVVS